MIKAVIFDYGEVMEPESRCVEDIALAYKVSTRIIKKKIKPFLSIFQKGIIKENEFWNKFSLALKKPIPKNSRDLWRECIERNFHIYPEMKRFVKKIKSQGIKTAVLSNTIESHVKVIEKHRGYNNFDVVVLSCREKLRKPEPKIYLLTVKRLKVKPKECIFIDDRNEFLKPAKKLGIKTILARNPKQVIHDVYNILG
jgi:putative hydrolase of the HAD superfamily